MGDAPTAKDYNTWSLTKQPSQPCDKVVGGNYMLATFGSAFMVLEVTGKNPDDRIFLKSFSRVEDAEDYFRTLKDEQEKESKDE